MKFSELIIALGLGENLSLDYGDPEISGVSTLLEAQPKDLGFLESSRFFPQLTETKAGALFINTDPQVLELVNSLKIPYLSVPQPRLLFARAIALFYPPKPAKSGIHPTAVIESDVEIGAEVYIAPHVVIGSGSKIGNGVVIYPNVTIYEDVIIGDRTVLHANCVIHERSEIGKNCVIHSGAAIGAEGFGFVPSSDGTWAKMQQVGKTILEDNVEVGCNAAIDRGAVGDTRIGKGSKIDNLVQIGHGCQLAENCLMAGQSGLAGGVKLGRNVILAGQAGIANHIKVGDRTIIGAQSGVGQDLDANLQILGAPAIDAKTFIKAAALFRRLPEIYKIVKNLQKRFQD
ncbi:UDP-3-O-(3-hydroxymyristoyl) glucosamine N-acyltransferase [Synechococcus sp. PCC 7502]|uniref:UDP-3-O-(3-hydroxymyristoyl)glucosamine N-acyltransferase n=1 Tax=Synechococcus sp. PCC 7502 TaxID=1173263 RepID=UPI00029F967A|nr:UDP-3-O-(3-hydroxymyristoyl)glucosamine N-acyltransferase [Synechococcus sp. PCC 7502]AFY73726.1 UDP-3-O-(3-hydroxymyristoyl) glucosamine N-acyltransferase [Synechococcus sp. PCC 7502]